MSEPRTQSDRPVKQDSGPRAELRVERGPLAGRVFRIAAKRPFLIGRSRRAQIVLPDPLVSRRHCQVEMREKLFFVRDLDSVNGTLVNGKRVNCCALLNGDRLQVGKTVFRFLGEESTDTLLGKEFDGYRITHLVGRGGMGSVYRAEQLSLRRHVAVKVLSEELAEDPAFVNLFLNEARQAAQLHHPNIVKVYSVGTACGRPYFTMEFVPGGTVEERLATFGPLAVEEALRIALQTAEGLVYAGKKKLVHRDIKPGNLLLHGDGTVKICDLGIAGKVDSPQAEPLRGGGSPYYIAPEQALGKPADLRSDIYSLGVCLFTMLAGRPPFGGRSGKEIALHHVKTPPPPLGSFRPDVPEPVCRLVAQMLAKRPGERPQTAQEARERLRELLAAPSSSTQVPRRHKRLVAVGAVLLIASAAALLAARAYSSWRKDNRWRHQLHRTASTAQELLSEKKYEKAQRVLQKFLAEHPQREGTAQLAALLKQAQQKAKEERETQRALQARAALQKIAGSTDPAVFERFSAQWKGTAAAEKARVLRERLIAALKEKEQREKEAEKVFTRLSAESARYAASGNFRLAYEVWRTYSFGGTAKEKLVAEKKDQLRQAAARLLEGKKRQAFQVARTGDAPGALAVLADLSMPPPLDASLAEVRKKASALAKAAQAQKESRARAEDTRLLAEARTAVCSLLRRGSFRAAASHLRQAVRKLHTPARRKEAEEFLRHVEVLCDIVRRQLAGPERRPLELVLFAGSPPVRVVRIREGFLEFYRKPGDRRAERIQWSELAPESFVRVLSALAASQEERRACDVLRQLLTGGTR